MALNIDESDSDDDDDDEQNNNEEDFEEEEGEELDEVIKLLHTHFCSLIYNQNIPLKNKK